MKLLDVSRLPREALYGPADNQIDLAAVVSKARTSITELRTKGLVKRNSSFGFAAAHPLMPGDSVNWKDPYEFIWFVVGWGTLGDRYIANAVRKLRPLLRERTDTIELRERALMDESFKPFRKRVVSHEPDGTFKLGDFPWGGGVLVKVGVRTLPVAVSSLYETEDHAIAMEDGGLVGSEMLKLDYPEEFGPKS